MKKKSLLNDRGSISYVLVFLFLTVILLTLFTLVIPMLISINTEFYGAAEDMMLDANNTAAGFKNEGIRTQFQDSMSAAADSIPAQVSIMAAFLQYAWIIIIIAVSVAIYLLTRQQVEVKGGVY